MRAAVLQGNSINIRNVSDPTPATGQLLVRPLFTGICGSDLSTRKQMAAMAASLPPEAQHQIPQIIPGHELSAEVIDIAPGTESALKAGDIITGLPFTHTHDGPQTIGLSPGHGGGLAELTCIDAVRSFRIPEGVPHDLAALTEPLSVGLHAANLASRNSGPNVVIGCGPVGLAVILALSLQGRGPILAADLSAERRSAAALLGADIVIDPDKESPLERWQYLGLTPHAMSPLLPRTFRGLPPGANIFECTGAQGMIDQIIKGAPPHSHIIVAGVCPHEEKFAPLDGILRELTLEFSFAYRPEEFAAALAMIEAHPGKAARLITSRQPLANTEAAFDSLAKSPSEIKILIDPRS
ncbi:zinc-binding dehydrogenase [Hyphomonas sp. WL0036]|uniref:zinc-binding dehydrogenase n=1 Tax=Hyphomonas sediminis TaxID=2866160 RepID=UPI001C8244D1|nr:zinc-binding dehydrogenase [Hyphomonas sediminis]MBY9068346.1 zinc-binding dehydrogenase [Hyphomonas sediminis]